MSVSSNGQLGTGDLNGKEKPAVESLPTSPPPAEPATEAKPKRVFKEERFEHPLILKQSPFWSRAILWTGATFS